MIDLGYGEEPRIGGLLEHIDDARERAAQRGALAAWLSAAQLDGTIRSGPVAVVHPTVWGGRRTAALLGELHAIGVEAHPVPRAAALARSHADATIVRCAVIETRLLPDTGGHWSAHLVERRAGEWTIARSAVAMPEDVPADERWAAVLGAADTVIVDGPDGTVQDAIRTTTAPSGGGVLRADPVLVARHGAPAVGDSLVAAIPPVPPLRAGGRRRTGLTVAVVCLLVACAWLAGRVGQADSGPAVRDETVGDVRIVVPGTWHRTDLSGDRPMDGAGVRAVFADPDDGRRIVVVVTELRAGSTRASVAESLANRLRQRGDHVVREFASDAVFGGRHVISYRETPASGPALAWYIHVDGRTQVSVGCQRGSGAHVVGEECADAVASIAQIG